MEYAPPAASHVAGDVEESMADRLGFPATRLAVQAEALEEGESALAHLDRRRPAEQSSRGCAETHECLVGRPGSGLLAISEETIEVHLSVAGGSEMLPAGPASYAALGTSTGLATFSNLRPSLARTLSVTVSEVGRPEK